MTFGASVTTGFVPGQFTTPAAVAYGRFDFSERFADSGWPAGPRSRLVAAFQ